MILRCHHLLCIQKFTGHGYDQSFTEHMTKIVKALKEKLQTPVQLCCVCDDVCRQCPNRRETICESEAKVEWLDRAVMAHAQLSQDRIYTWQELKERTTHILQTDEFDEICQECSWYELCKNTEIGSVDL